jgi:glycine cleavage system aminomethyltransferase T
MSEDRNYISIHDDQERFIAEYQKVDLEAKKLTKQAQQMKEKIVELFKNKEGVLMNESGEVVADFVITRQERFDSVSFKEFSPDVYELYKKEVLYKTLRVNKVG